MSCPWELADCVQNPKILEEKCKIANFDWNDKIVLNIAVQPIIVLLELGVDTDGLNNLAKSLE